ncbi:MAG: HAD hydrolase-like protein [Alphaproteobacteria bacterium]|nr:HAD hydrolase-like protein [Alphaproteobacteria bacterium]
MSTIFFDLDGTLTDPKEGIARCIQYALETLGAPAPDTDDLLWCIGPPLKASLARLLDGDEDAAGQALALYRERFTETGLYENAVYDGISDVLSALQADGHSLFVATSKPHVYAERIVSHFELDGFFETVFGSELDGTRADKSELLAYASERIGIDVSDAVMIGDREHDMIGARNNGLLGIGVLYGYGTQEELQAAGAQRLVASPGSLLAAL